MRRRPGAEGGSKHGAGNLVGCLVVVSEEGSPFHLNGRKGGGPVFRVREQRGSGRRSQTRREHFDPLRIALRIPCAAEKRNESCSGVQSAINSTHSPLLQQSVEVHGYAVVVLITSGFVQQLHDLPDPKGRV